MFPIGGRARSAHVDAKGAFRRHLPLSGYGGSSMHEKRRSAPAKRASRQWGCGLIAIAALSFGLVARQAPAKAASEVQGEPGDMRLLVDNASTEEALQALARSFELV